jgi:hypothetical protein
MVNQAWARGPNSAGFTFGLGIAHIHRGGRLCAAQFSAEQ